MLLTQSEKFPISDKPKPESGGPTKFPLLMDGRWSDDMKTFTSVSMRFTDESRTTRHAKYKDGKGPRKLNRTFELLDKDTMRCSEWVWFEQSEVRSPGWSFEFHRNT